MSKVAQPTGNEGLEHRSIRFPSPRFKLQHHALDTQASQGMGQGGQVGFRWTSFVSLCSWFALASELHFDPAPSAARSFPQAWACRTSAFLGARSASCLHFFSVSPGCFPAPALPGPQRHLTTSPSARSLLAPPSHLCVHQCSLQSHQLCNKVSAHLFSQKLK